MSVWQSIKQKASWQPRDNHWVVWVPLLLALLALGLIAQSRFEKKAVVAYDSQRYLQYMQNLNGEDFFNGIEPQFYQRFVPSVIVGSVMRWLEVPMNKWNSVRYFRGFNLLLLAGTLVCLHFIFLHWNLSPLARLGGYWLWLATYSTRQLLDWAVMTDQMAVFLAAALLLAFLKQKPLWVAILTLVGYFTHPVLGPLGLLLLAFPLKPVNFKWMGRYARIGLLVLVLVLLRQFWEAFVDLSHLLQNSRSEYFNSITPEQIQSYGSEFVVTFALAFWILFSNKELYRVQNFWPTKGTLYFLLAVLGVLLVYHLLIVQVGLQERATSVNGLVYKLRWSLYRDGNFNKLNIWYGTLLVVFVMGYFAIMKLFYGDGVGAAGVLALTLALMPVTNARQIAPFFVVVAAYVIRWMDRWPPLVKWLVVLFGATQVWIFAQISLTLPGS